MVNSELGVLKDIILLLIFLTECTTRSSIRSTVGILVCCKYRTTVVRLGEFLCYAQQQKIRHETCFACYK